MKKKYWQMTHKFGCKLPHSVEEALEIDRQMGTDHWWRALNKEMAKEDMIGFQEIGCHIVFNIKMDFTRKVRFCAGGT